MRNDRGENDAHQWEPASNVSSVEGDAEGLAGSRAGDANSESRRLVPRDGVLAPATRPTPAGQSGQLAPDAVTKEARVLASFFRDDVKRFEFLYENLSIVDSKASSLMAFNAIGLAAIAIWLEAVPANALHLVLDVVFFLLIVSSAICFRAIRVHWSSVEDFAEPERQARELIETREKRTAHYRRAWSLAIASVIVFGAVAFVHTIGTGLHAAGVCSGRCADFFSPKVWGNREPPAESTRAPTGPERARAMRDG